MSATNFEDASATPPASKGAGPRPVLSAICAAAAFALAAPALAQVDATTLPCAMDAAVRSGDGKLRLALIVGVDGYQGAKALKGAVADASKVYDLLVEDQKRAFPKENVCVLTDAEATYAGFKTAFSKAILDRAAGADQVVIYFAGHGSQLADDNNDDGDGWDETLFLHDSFARERPAEGIRFNQLRDDEFNGMLADLYKNKTENLTVILDSCHSGTATRDIEGEDIARYVEPDETARASPAPAGAGGDGGASLAEFTPASFPKAVFMSAARDEEKAIERDGAGLFTRALVSILRSPDGARITYNQLKARIQAELGASGRQTPVLSGDGERLVFSNEVPYKPRYDWKISEVDAQGATIRGLPTIGMGVGAEFLILPGSMTVAQARDPNTPKARMRAATRLAGNEWRLTMVKNFNRGAINAGDFAMLATPSPQARRLKVRIRPASEPGGVADAAGLRGKIVAELGRTLAPENAPLVSFIGAGHDLEVSTNRAGKLQIEDARGTLRNAYDSVAPAKVSQKIAVDLANHFMQRVLLNEWKIGGGSMVANETLQVRLKPVVNPNYNNCKRQYQETDWAGPPNTPQRIPLCATYEVEVKLAAGATVPVNIGGAMMSADGSMVKIPYDNETIELEPGGDWTSFGIENGFQATPDSYGKKESLFIIALPSVETGGEPPYEIPWHLLSTFEEGTRAPVGRGLHPQREYGTYTILPIETVANARFGEDLDGRPSGAGLTREYTIDKFDIAPYLPDDPQSALHRVLTVAQGLADYKGSGDGVPYKQHPWCKGSTDKNLANGIDCSRAIWYAFTRAGLAYNRRATSVPDEAQCVAPYDPTKDGYLYTGDMARKDYWMTDNFVECSAANEAGERSFRLGDVLVYRDKTKGDGHVVMVIDAAERIAWGSHGWDGNPTLIGPDTGAAPVADRGVEFQKIKFKSDWERWDRGTMELSACWRHKEFIEEARTAAGRPGYAALCQAFNLDVDPEVNPAIVENLCWRLLKQ